MRADWTTSLDPYTGAVHQLGTDEPCVLDVQLEGLAGQPALEETPRHRGRHRQRVDRGDQHPAGSFMVERRAEGPPSPSSAVISSNRSTGADIRTIRNPRCSVSALCQASADAKRTGADQGHSAGVDLDITRAGALERLRQRREDLDVKVTADPDHSTIPYLDGLRVKVEGLHTSSVTDLSSH